MGLKDFIQEFERLKDKNEFDHRLYDTDRYDLERIEATVTLSNTGYSASAKGYFKVEGPSFGIRVKINPNQKNESVFELVSQNLLGAYYIRRDKESTSTTYGFKVENTNKDNLELEVNIYDKELE